MGYEHHLSRSQPGRAVRPGTHWKYLNLLQLVGHMHNVKRFNVKRCCHDRPEKTHPVAYVVQGSESLRTVLYYL